VVRAACLAIALGCAAALAWAVDPTGEAPRPAGKAVGVPTARDLASPIAPAARARPAASASKAAKKHRTRRTQDSTAAHLMNPRDAADTPAVRYAKLSQPDCEAELASRHIDFIRETAGAVLAPVRLTGPLRGVVFRIDAKEAARAVSPYEIADCRLVLAIDDFAGILRSHDIVEVRHYSMYRPPKGWPDGKIGARHDGALALDAGRFIDSAGKVLDVDRDFHGAIDAKTCGEGAAPRPATPEALALRAILCEAVDQHLFNVVLTPNYNRPHHNHFHLEVTAGVAWFLVH
jgi:hypothetical protein